MQREGRSSVPRPDALQGPVLLRQRQRDAWPGQGSGAWSLGQGRLEPGAWGGGREGGAGGGGGGLEPGAWGVGVGLGLGAWGLETPTLSVDLVIHF